MLLKHLSGDIYWVDSGRISPPLSPAEAAQAYVHGYHNNLTEAKRDFIKSLEEPTYNWISDLLDTFYHLDLVGSKEAGEILGWDTQRVSNYRRRGSFPVPISELAMGPVWTRSQIEEYARCMGHRLNKRGWYVDKMICES